MNKAKILERNAEQFLIDIKLVRSIIAHAPTTAIFFKVTKKQVIEVAEFSKIHYRVSTAYKTHKPEMVIE